MAQSAGSRGQEPVLFDMSLEDNVKYGYPEATEAQVHEAAKAATWTSSLGRQWLCVVGREHWCSEVDGPSRTPWGEALRRTEAARGHRPGAVAGAPVHAPGRGHVGPRLRVGEAGAAGDAGDKDGQDKHHRGPSSLHNPKLGTRSSCSRTDA